MSIKDKIVKALALRWIKAKVMDLRRVGNVSNVSKVLKFLDGWKLMIGVAVLFGSKVYDAMNNGHSGDIIGSVLVTLNWLPVEGFDAQAIGVAAASGLALWGFIAKLVKAQQQSKAGTSVSGLLSTEGYVNQYIKTGKE